VPCGTLYTRCVLVRATLPSLRSKPPSPTRSERFDRLRQELIALAGETGFTVPGTLQTRFFECTRQNNCRCHEDPAKRHGPYHYWSRKIRGKLVCTSLSEEQLAFVRQAIENGRRIDRVVKQMHQESLRAVEKICSSGKRTRLLAR
jgi:hypothetical protein